MARAQVKKIKIPIGANDEGLAEMFNQMLGTGTVNVNIAYPRYKRIRTLCTQIVKIFRTLAESPIMKPGSAFEAEKQELLAWCAEASADIARIFSMDFSDYEWNLNTLDDELRKNFSSIYMEMKRSALVSTFIVMCDRLVTYKRHFDMNKLNHRFITSMSGVEWRPFPFSQLNLKYAMSLPIGTNAITFFMTILSKAYELSHALYMEIQSPDIDVDQFVEFIMGSIDKIQKRPELSRCRDAFQKIKESVHLLKARFNGYYRDFISTNDSTIMMQHFIIDVSKSTDASPKVTAQFRTIIGYYRKITQDQISDPKVRMLFDRMNASFKDLDRDTENIVKIRDEAAASDDASDPDDSTPLPAPTAKAAADV